MKSVFVDALLIGLSLCSRAGGQSNVIMTVAGGAAFAFPANVTSALDAPLGSVSAVAVDSHGNVYVADTSNNQVFEIDTSGGIRVIAGSGIAGFSGDGGLGTAAMLNAPRGVALDATGNLFIADSINNRVRQVSAAGIISTVAGDGNRNFSGDGGPALSASFYEPWGLAMDAAGNLYIADWGNARIRRLSAGGVITTFAGNGSNAYSGDGGAAASASLYGPTGLTLDKTGNLFIADSNNNRVRRVSVSGIITTVAGTGNRIAGFSGDGGSATSALLFYPEGVAVDAAGNIFVADNGNNRIRKVSVGGIITTVAGNGMSGFGGDGGPATSASFVPSAVSLDATGNLFVADSGNFRVREVSTSGIISTLAGNGNYGLSGDGGPATSASFGGIDRIALDGTGNLFVADYGNHRVRKISPSGTITTVSGNGLIAFSGDGGPATAASLVPSGVAVDSSGDLFIADEFNNRIRKVSPSGIITTIAGDGNSNSSGDGGPATSASLRQPAGIALDVSGNLYIADPLSQRIRKVSPSGIITTFAGSGTNGFSGDGGPATSASLNYPGGVAADSSGDIFIADSNNNRIRKVSAAGVITTVAGNGPTCGLGCVGSYSGDGGLATSASLSEASDVAVDSSGNLFIADTVNFRIRKVSPGGVITTFVGNGNNGHSGDGGPATAASIYPSGVALDRFGNMFVADTYMIREVSSSDSPLTVSPTSLSFSHGAGGSSSQQITLASADGLIWSASASSNWINLDLTSGTTPGVITVFVNTAALAPGFYGATVTILNPSASPPAEARIEVYLTVVPVFAVSSTALNFQIPQGGAAQSQSLQTGGTAGTAWQATAVTSNSGSWLSISPVSGQIPASLTAMVNPGALMPGIYGGSITMLAPQATPSSTTIGVVLTVTPPRGPAGTITTVAGSGNAGFSGDAGLATSAALLSPNGAVVDSFGNLFIADTYNSRIRQVSNDGTITTVAGNGIPGYSGDGGPAISASLNLPGGVAVDGTGNLFIADTYNNLVRKISPDGSMTTAAGNGVAGYSGDGGPAISASLNLPGGVAVDGTGNVFVVDTGNNRIREISPDGNIRTIAGNGTAAFSGDGGAAITASLNLPSGVAADSSANLFIADSGNNRIRAVSSAGIITTIAGNGSIASSGDGGAAIAAALNIPTGVAVDGSGNLFIADSGGNRIRVWSAGGIITSVAGNGSAGFSGDGETATSASLNEPTSVAVDALGNLFIADSGNNRIREVLASGLSALPSNIVANAAGNRR